MRLNGCQDRDRSFDRAIRCSKVGCTVVPKWPIWAHLCYSVFYSVSELGTQAVLPPGALFHPHQISHFSGLTKYSTESQRSERCQQISRQYSTRVLSVFLDFFVCVLRYWCCVALTRQHQ